MRIFGQSLGGRRRIRPIIGLTAWILAALPLIWGTDDNRVWDLSPITSPTVGKAHTPGLAQVPGGGMLFTWISLSGDRTALQGAILTGDRWSKAFTVPTSGRLSAQSAVVLQDGTIVAQWVSSQDIHLSRSRDRGRTWSAPLTLPRTAVGEQADASLLAQPNGETAVVWLGPKGGAGERQALYSATLRADGKLTAAVVVDSDVCACCPTSIANNASGMAVAYRDRRAREVRDISVARFSSGKWMPAVAAPADGWNVNGCPGNGPAIGSSGDRMALVWFTAAQGRRRLRLAGSIDGGRTFGWSKDVRIGMVTGHPHIAAIGPDTFVAIWVEPSDQGGRLSAVAGSFTGEVDPAWEVARASSVRIGRPRVAPFRGGALFAWIDSESGRIRLAHATRRPSK